MHILYSAFICKLDNDLDIHVSSAHMNMQMQRHALPAQLSSSNLILSCASKSDISGEIQCVRATFTHRFCGCC